MRNTIHHMDSSMKCCSSKNARFSNFVHSKSGLLSGIILMLLLSLISTSVSGQAAASSNYDTQTGTLGTTYSWIDCSGGTEIVTGDDAEASFYWPFEFSFYDNTYTTANSFSAATNGFIRLDGTANTSYTAASAYTLSSGSTELGQIIALAVYDDKVGDNSGWVRGIVTGSAPNRIMTIEYSDIEIDYNDGRYADVQVSFYETSNLVVIKFGTDNITASGADMGIHSGVSGFYNKWQEVASGTNNSWIEYTPSTLPPSGPSASWNYGTLSGTTGSTYSWIDCTSGTTIVSGDDAQAQINWPFDFSYYDNNYTTSDLLSMCTNGFIRLDGVASTDYSAASAYDLTSTATNFGQIIAMAMYDDNVSGTGWVRYRTTGTAPNQIFTVEYNDLEIDYNDNLFADVQVSFYESTNKIVLKLGTDNINKSGVDMGLHSGVNTFFNKWQEVLIGTNNAWIEYTPPYVEVNATIGTATASYASLKAAFDKINDGTHQGIITIKINHSTTETEAAVLNASGTGSANFASVNIYPTLTGLSINGNLATALIDLNGADNVTIDGRLNATGTTKDLSIINTSTGSATGTSAIRFINDASNNTVKYCTIKSSESRSSSGIIFFSTAATSSGNDNNVIENNDITNAADANRPVNAIYSSGTSGKDNSGNIIRNNNIYDFIKHASASRGILLEDNTTTWTIDGNSFYETESFTPTGTVTYDAIKINNVSGNGFTVSNNYFGGSEAECEGTAWTKTNATNNVFNAINLNIGTTVASSVQNNTIRNFNWSNSGIATWTAINVVEGSVNIGTVTGNTIGVSTGSNSIRVTGGSNGQNIYGIQIASTGVINCFNNYIGSITGLTTSTFSTHIYGIDLSGSAVANIKSNTIGSTTTAYSIFASSASTANVQKVYGIYTRSTGTTAIHENTISNLRNNTSNAAVGTLGLINGIYLTAGTNTVDENTIRDISIANANTSTYTPAIAGIYLNTTTEAQSLHQNLIYNISNTSSSFTGLVAGIFTRNSVGASAGNIDANFIHSLSVNAASTGASIYGIYENTDGIVYSNNIITLGGSTSTEMYGIYDVGNSGKTGSFYFNTIYISGTNSGSEKSYALRYNTNSNTRDLRNNILFNARTGGSGGHYAIYYDATGGTFTADYNDYYVSGTGGVIAYYGGDKNTLTLLQTATTQDASSLNIDPVFTTAGGTDADDYVTLASLPGVAIPGVTTTYHGITRGDPPKMGALEVSPTFTWQGNTSTDFATASNWTDGAVPPNGADVIFAANPANDCYLDQNRTLSSITNTSAKKLYINAKQLTLTGNIVSATANQIDASSASSVIVFAGSALQSISSGIFVSNTIDGLELNNIHGLTQNGDLILPTTFTLTNGDYDIGANTLTINGAISTTSGTLSGGSSTNIVIGGSGASTTMPGVALNNLTINRANGISLGGSVSVAGTLVLTAGTLTLGANTLTISGNTPTLTSGNIDASNASSTVVFSNSSAISLAASLFTGNINNLTINGAGLTAVSNLTVNGILDLQSANPSASKGSLDMSTYTLNMGSAATTSGIGDVTGIVKREHTFVQNVTYSFGSQYTTFTFSDANLKPTWISLKISIGSVAPWNPWDPTPDGKVKRLYKVASSANASTSAAAINMRYLLSELDATNNDESKLVFWHKFTTYGGGLPHEHGKSNQDFTNHFLGVTGLILGGATTADLDDSQVTMAYPVSEKNTWKGEVAGHETEWEQAQNWTDGHVPLSTEEVLIPDGLSYYPSLTASSNAVASTIEIHSGASVSANSYTITVYGAGGAWINDGTFYPGTGNVIFTNSSATYSGTTNFYNLTINNGAILQMLLGSVIRIAGAVNNNGTWRTVINGATTVEYNGADQTIVIPNPATNRYYNLILSGSGTKTLSGTPMVITGNFNITGTTTVTVGAQVDVAGNLSIDAGTTIAAGAYTYNIGGNISNNGTFTASVGNTIVLNGTSLQSIDGASTPANFYNLTIDNNGGVVFYKDVNVLSSLSLSDGNMIIGGNTLGIYGTISQASGYIETSPTSSLSFLTYLGTPATALSIASNLFSATPIVTNLTINRTGGVIFNSGITVNGILNLQSTNPTDFKGSLDMGSNTLSMGATATTIGAGDVTGIVKRQHTFNINTEYSFGNQFTTVSFANVGTLPSQISLKISIGNVPIWGDPNLGADAVKRVYDMIHVGGSETSATLKGHYLDSELNGNDEQELIDLTYIFSPPLFLERGRSDINTTDNWISLNNNNFSLVPLAFGEMELGFGVATNNVLTWDGSVDTDWTKATNWTPALVPDEDKIIIIPDAATTPNDPLLPDSSAINSISIEPGGILNSGVSSELVIMGSTGAWVNTGTFNASTGSVYFNHGVVSEIVTVAGSTDFYYIEVGENTTMQPVSGNYLSISGAEMAYASSVVDFSSVNNTVEWNGVGQTIVNPNGIGGNSGYYNLILSGSGTKTMPATAMTINGDFTTSGTTTATAADSLIVIGNFTIDNGAGFSTGAFEHTIAGNFENNGTFTTSSGKNVTFNGTVAQTIDGSSTTSFDGLCIANPNGVSLEIDIDVNGVLSLCNGPFQVGTNTLGINGTISNLAGNIEVSSSSSLSFGGTTAIALNNLFNENPTINNLTINRSGGVTLGNESITVNGALALTDGTLTLAANTLTLAGPSPTRTSGTINASDTAATLMFTNSAAVTLPASIFSENVNNLSINGTGGITSGEDISVDGILNLISANPSTIKGSLDMGTDTLHMGADATTTGTGDVTGIVKRQHTFENGIEYSFGNQFTTFYFLGISGGIKPTWISCRIDIGAAPSWRSTAVKRFYSFAQSGGTDRVITKLYYLDTELDPTETDESKLLFWGAYPNPNYENSIPRGSSEHNVTDNWLTLKGMAINMMAPGTLDYRQWGLSYTNVDYISWTGKSNALYSGDWSLPGNWIGGIPSASDSVLIPTTLPDGSFGYPYRNLLPVISPALARTIEIEPGASIIVDDYDITVSGFGDAWVNDGTFSPGTGTVTFNHGDEGEIVNLNGTTNFNNLTIEDKTYIEAATDCITRIAGTLTTSSGSILDFTANTNTVEYNGTAAQTVINPTTATTPGYHNLIISGSGIKTLPASSLNILGNFTTNASISATGNTLVMVGTAAQNISGSVAPNLDNFTISNTTAAVTAGVNINCSGIFTNSGELDMTTYALAVTGTVSNSGTVKTTSISSTPLPSGKAWGGTVQYYTTTGSQTVMAGTYNNLTLGNTSGAQSASGNLTVNGTITTTSGGLLNMVTHQLLGTLTTITNGGTIQTQNTSSTPIPTGKIWGGTVQYNASTGGQTTMAGTYSALTLNNTSGTQTASGAIAATTLNTTAGGTLNMVTYALSGLTTISNLGTLRTQNTSTTPFTSGLSWGGTVTFDGAAAQTLPTSASTFNNLSISNTAGVITAANQTVNGILNLSVANPDATHGSLDMSNDTLYFGANATTTGVGDVTGIMTRTSFIVNTAYTYGNPNQYVLFPVVTGQALPDTFSLRVTLPSPAPSWVTDATKRLYEISQSGGANTKATFRANYLDSELASGVDESVLSIWQNVYPSSLAIIEERGWSDYNLEENWITFSDANFGLIPPSLGDFLVTIAPTQVAFRTWNGNQGTVTWNTATNWTPQGVPTSSLGIVIPDVDSSNSFSPEIPVGATGKYIIIQDEGIVNATTSATLTLSGNGNVWSMESGGVFNAGNSDIIFAGDTADGVVRISGETDFYDITITDTTNLRPGVNAYIGIEGTISNNGILDAATNHNTIEFKKDASFTIPNPNGTTPGYHSLIISGTGTKTLPTPLVIWHDFTNNGTVATGTGSVTFDGLHSEQTIGGSSTTAFYDLTIANTGWEATTEANITVSNTLTINDSATLNPGATNTIGGTGTLTGHGTAKVTRITSTPDMATQYPISTKTLTNLSVDYCGAGNQSVTAINYGTLKLSANGIRTITFASTGTIGVSDVFDPDLSTTSYVITGSTLTANGTGSQTVPAFNYYNVNVIGDRGGDTITLVNGGTIGIAGHSTVSATNADFVITNSTIDINGSGNQTIDPFSFYNVIFSGGGTKTTTGDLVVYVGFTVESGVTLDMSTSTLSGSMAGGISNSGTVKTSNTSATPIPDGKTWGGTVEYASSSAQTVVEGTYQNLTMSGAGGGTVGDDITVDGVLSLSANPSSTKGILETSSDTLFMGALATTIGAGDVTGIIKRQHTFENEIEYTFGNQYTSFYFLGISGNTKPTWLACRVAIGTAPTWRSTAVKRHYSFAQSGGNDRVITKLHYLDSELDASETDESKLIFWGAYPGPTYENTCPRGSSNYNDTDNWLTLNGMAIHMLAAGTLDFRQWGLSYSNVTHITWTGQGSSPYVDDWSLPGNWIGGIPSSKDSVLIPGTLPEGSNGYPNKNSLPVLIPAEMLTLEIESGATVDASDFDISIAGSTDAWVNNGTFIAGTGTVVFNNGSTSNTATIEGTTDFYNLTVSDNTKIQPATGSILGIAGTLTPGTGSILDFSTNANTVDYNGNAAQTVVNPGAIYGYHHLIFSGSGTKTLPSSTVNMFGDITFNSTTITTGNTLNMDGSSAQIINGSTATIINNLTINNEYGVTLDIEALTTNIGTLLINIGKLFNVAPGRQLSVSGALTNSAGTSGFILQSDATGTASLLHKLDNIPATVQRYISGDAEDWHFLSTPVSNQGISGDWLPSGTYGNGTGYDLYVWNEPTNCWIYLRDSTSTVDWPIVHPTSNFVAGKGYLYSVEAANPTKSFVGNLNNGDQSIALSYSGTVPDLKGFNFIGNPYPSSIDWQAENGWTRDMLVTSGGGYDMWIWNPEANNYGVFNSNGSAGSGTNDVTQYIAPMQGFFVETSVVGNLEMENSIRVHEGANDWLKHTGQDWSVVKAKIKSQTDGSYDEVLLQFASPVNEPGAPKLFSNDKSAPSLYLPLNDKVFSVMYLTNTEDNESLPLMFEPGKNGEFSFSIDFEYYDFDIVILEDKKTNTFHNLKENPQYSFSGSTDDLPNRFVLHFAPYENQTDELPAHIYSNGNEITLDLTLVNEIADVRVIDLLGRTILLKSLEGKAIHHLRVNSRKQIVIVYANTKNAFVIRKIYIN